MKKSKGQTIDLLYTNKKETNKRASNKKKTVGAHDCARNTKKKTTKTNKTQNNDNIINLDNEIIIGLTPKKEEEKKRKNTKTKKTRTKKKKIKAVGAHDCARKTKNNSSNKKTKPNTKKENPKKKTTNKKQDPKKKIKLKIIKWTLLLGLIITAIVLFMMSSIFNIKEIVVINNSKISSEEIIKLSTLTTDVNMFKTTNSTIRNGIKTNSYIEDVNIKRSINGTITLNIEERVTTYMLKFANSYVYINNQGYILEISESPLEVTIITGFTTINEEIKPGNRLNTEDLQKLDDVNKIIETSKNTPLANIITEIDISKSTDYKLTIASHNKTVKLGQMTNINIKLQMAGKVFEAESGKSGEIYFQDDGKKAIFKEDVAR